MNYIGLATSIVLGAAFVHLSYKSIKEAMYLREQAQLLSLMLPSEYRAQVQRAYDSRWTANAIRSIFALASLGGLAGVISVM